MIKIQKQIGSLLIGLSISAASPALAGTAARAVGSGGVFPTLNHALDLNPAGLAESPSVSLQGLYNLDDSNIFGSATIGQNGFGAGFNYTRIDASSSSVEAFGFGAKLGKLMIGAAFNTTEFADMGINMGATFDLKGLRVAAIVGGLTDSITFVGAGIGVSMGMWGAEIDAGKAMITGIPDTYVFNAGIHATMQSLSLGVGYKTTMVDSDLGDGDIWAGLSFAVTKGVSVEGFYKAGGSNLQLGDWSAGARFEL